MKRHSEKIARAAHIKRNTQGTSNEISFSVLDAARQALDGEQTVPEPRFPRLGVISLFTLGRGRKPIATPVKEKGLHLSTGEFVSAEEAGSGAGLTASLSISGSSSGSGLPDVVKPTSDMAASMSSHVPSAISGRVESGTSLNGLSARRPTVSTAQNGSVSSVSPSPGSSRSQRTAERSWVASESEVASRKAARKRRKSIAIAGLAVVAMTALAVGVSALVNVVKEQQDVHDRFVAAIGEIEQTDEVLVAFDELVVSIINDQGMELDVAEISEQYEALADGLDEAVVSLAEAQLHVEQVQADLVDTGDKEVANQALATIKARENMIESGRVVVEETIAARTAMAYAQQGWDYVIAADALARDAAYLVTDTNAESVESSMAKSNEAVGLFQQAEARLAAAQTSYPAVDLSFYVSYVRLRLDAQYCAIASDQAYLDRDKELAASKNDEYNTLDAQAAELVKELSTSPSDLERLHLEEVVASEIAFYTSERALASSADGILREYLGS